MPSFHWARRLRAIATAIAVSAFGGLSASGYALAEGLPYEPLAAAVVPGGEPRFSTAEEMEQFVDGFMSEAFDRYRLVGGVVAIVKDGELFFSKGYGYRDLENRLPVEADTTMFRVGSVSKLFTWTAVMQLVEQGRLDLDADVNTYIDGFAIPDTFAEPITLRNIMTHSTGLDEWVVGGHFFNHDPAAGLPLATALERYLPDRIRPATRDFGADRSSAYSNWGTALAGYIVERVSGMPFDDYVERNIFAPLGMASTTFREPPAQDFGDGAIHAYAPDADGTMRRRPFEHAQSFAPAGSGSATATDMARFAIAHMNDGGAVLAPETAREMHARSLALNPHTNGHTLGFFEIFLNGRRAIEHTGGTVHFHSDLLILPEEKFAMFVSFNTPSGRPARIAFKKAFMDRYFPATLPATEPLADAGARDTFHAGAYRLAVSNGRQIDKLMAFGGEVEVSAVAPGQVLIDGLDGTADTWTEVAPNIVRNDVDGTLATFTTDTGGRVVRLTGAETNNPLERLAWYETTRFHTWLLGICLVLAATFVPRLLYSRTPILERTFVVVLGASVVCAALGFAIAAYWVTGNLAAFVFETPLSFRAVAPLLWVSGILAIISACLLAFIWVRRGSAVSFRLHGLVTIIAIAALLWSGDYWNLV